MAPVKDEMTSAKGVPAERPPIDEVLPDSLDSVILFSGRSYPDRQRKIGESLCRSGDGECKIALRHMCVLGQDAPINPIAARGQRR